jgi:hypothetical protein
MYDFVCLLGKFIDFGWIRVPDGSTRDLFKDLLNSHVIVFCIALFVLIIQQGLVQAIEFYLPEVYKSINPTFLNFLIYYSDLVVLFRCIFIISIGAISSITKLGSKKKPPPFSTQLACFFVSI